MEELLTAEGYLTPGLKDAYDWRVSDDKLLVSDDKENVDG